MKQIYTLNILLCLITVALGQFNSANVTSTKPPDIYLNVPNLSVSKVSLVVQKLNVTLNLKAKIADLVSLEAGVSATADTINLTITNVKAELELVVRLDTVVEIINKTLQTISANPELITGIVKSVGDLVENIAGVLSTTVNSLGQTVRTIVDSAGNIVEQTLDATGKVASQIVGGNINALQIIDGSNNDRGQYVVKVRNSDGSIYQITYNRKGGTVVSVQVLQGPTAAIGSTTSVSSSSTTSSPSPSPSSPSSTAGTTGKQ
eukprot:TRINITY_DN2353_c0_g1_i1.p1 TRINITY_DN2353_c0_g1~~TRINITY_DN2353_c0_g1_i1.p1  ORF type:complete len:262 (+),score=67.23 TRINITY_DN2353_c0_g1_i1:35-820(+)